MNPFPSIMDAVFNGLASEEGWFDKETTPNRPQRNNNPLNLDFVHQAGAKLETIPPGVNEKARFAKWPTVGQGTAGAYVQIGLWIERGLSLRQVVEIQAPPNENNTEEYLANVLSYVKQLFPNINPDQPLSSLF